MTAVPAVTFRAHSPNFSIPRLSPTSNGQSGFTTLFATAGFARTSSGPAIGHAVR